MKILMALEKFNIVISEDYSMGIAFQKELESRGHEVEIIDGMGVFDTSIPDIFIFYKGHTTLETLQNLKDHGTTLVNIFPDAYSRIEHGYLNHYKIFDKLLTVIKDGIEYDMLKSNMPNTQIEYFPQAVDPSLYDISNTYIPYNANFNWIFIGSYYKERKELSKHLHEIYKFGRIFGNNWERSEFDVPWTGFDVYFKAFSWNCKRAVVTLGDISSSNGWGTWSNRVYKTMASKVPYLSSPCQGLREIFKEDKEILFYRSFKELKEIVKDPIKYYGAGHLIEVAIGGSRAVQNYTYEKQAKRLCELIL